MNLFKNFFIFIFFIVFMIFPMVLLNESIYQSSVYVVVFEGMIELINTVVTSAFIEVTSKVSSLESSVVPDSSSNASFFFD